MVKREAIFILKREDTFMVKQRLMMREVFPFPLLRVFPQFTYAYLPSTCFLPA